MKQPAQPYEFRAKPAWQRLLIMVGGVLMNVVLAIAIYIGMSYAWGDRYLSNDNVKYGYVFNDLGKEIGFQDGDKILDIEGEPVDDYSKILPDIVFNQAKYVTVERNGAQVRVDIPDSFIAQMLKSPDLLTVRMPFIIDQLGKEGGAKEAGMLPGDTLISFNGESMRYFDQFAQAFKEHKGETAQIGVARDSAGVTKIFTLPVKISDDAIIGVYPIAASKIFTLNTHSYTFWQAIPQGFKRAGAEISSYWKQVKLIFTPKTEAYKSVGGIISIGNIFPSFWSWQVFWSITAFLSIALAVMNILPIPALDGGHVLFLLYEVITRRKPSEKFMEYAQVVGMILVFGLIIAVTGNDIYRLFIK